MKRKLAGLALVMAVSLQLYPIPVMIYAQDTTYEVTPEAWMPPASGQHEVAKAQVASQEKSASEHRLTRRALTLALICVAILACAVTITILIW